MPAGTASTPDGTVDSESAAGGGPGNEKDRAEAEPVAAMARPCIRAQQRRDEKLAESGEAVSRHGPAVPVAVSPHPPSSSSASDGLTASRVSAASGPPPAPATAAPATAPGPPQNVQNGLVISPTPLAKILSGWKRWEMKTMDMKSTVGKTYALLPKGTNAVWGFATVESISLVPWSEMLLVPEGEDHPEIGCSKDQLLSYATASKANTDAGLYALKLVHIKALADPFPLPSELKKRSSCWDTFQRKDFPQYEIPPATYLSAKEVVFGAPISDWQETLRDIVKHGGEDLNIFSQKDLNIFSKAKGKDKSKPRTVPGTGSVETEEGDPPEAPFQATEEEEGCLGLPRRRSDGGATEDRRRRRRSMKAPEAPSPKRPCAANGEAAVEVARC